MRAMEAGIRDWKCKLKSAKCKFCRGTVTVPILLKKGTRVRHGFDMLADVGQPTLLKKGALRSDTQHINVIARSGSDEAILLVL